jgi:hypothetical protein
LQKRVRGIAPSFFSEGIDIAQTLMGIMWPRDHDVRFLSLDSYNPYRRGRSYTDPMIVRDIILREVNESVNPNQKNWRDLLKVKLAKYGSCRITTESSQGGELALAVAEILATPIDVGYLQFYASVERYEEDAISITVVLTLWEEI